MSDTLYDVLNSYKDEDFQDEDASEDKGVILCIVKMDGMKLQYASRDLRADPEVVEVAVSQNWRAFKYSLLPKYDEEYACAATRRIVGILVSKAREEIKDINKI